MDLIWAKREEIYFCAKDWTGSISLIGNEKFAVWRKAAEGLFAEIVIASERVARMLETFDLAESARFDERCERSTLRYLRVSCTRPCEPVGQPPGMGFAPQVPLSSGGAVVSSNLSLPAAIHHVLS
jgi:hypothetical protein